MDSSGSDGMYLGPNLGRGYVNTLMTALLTGLSGRVWDGKVGVGPKWKGAKGWGRKRRARGRVTNHGVLVFRKL